VAASKGVHAEKLRVVLASDGPVLGAEGDESRSGALPEKAS
jgi:hypothetical protein